MRRRGGGVRGGLTILPSQMPGKFELSKPKKKIGGGWGCGGGGGLVGLGGGDVWG